MEAVDKLRSRVQGHTLAQFLTIVRFPVLVARAVVGGRVQPDVRTSGISRALGQPTHFHHEGDEVIDTVTPPGEETLVTHPLSRQLWVEVKKSPNTPADQAIALGRSRDMCDVVLNDYTVSKVHAVFGGDIQSGQFIVMDLGSTNGTVVEGMKLDPRVATRVHCGQTIQLGRLVFEVLTPEEFFADLAGLRQPRTREVSLSA